MNAQDFRPPQIPAESAETPATGLPARPTLPPSFDQSPGNPADAFGLVPVQPRDNTVWQDDNGAPPKAIDETTLSLLRSGELPPTPERSQPGKIEQIKTRYPDGSIKIIKHVAQDEEGNYYPDGAWRLFNPQGEVLAEGQFHQGRMEGQWQRWHAAKSSPLFQSAPFNQFSPPFQSTATFSKGRLDGVWIIADREGRKIVEIPYREGKRDGTANWYYPSGERMRVANFKEGQLDGPLIEWNQQKKIVRNEEYIAGKKVVRNTAFYRPKQKQSEAYYLDPPLELRGDDDWWDAIPAPFTSRGQRIQHGPVTAWHANGQVKMKGQYLNDQRVGIFTWWHANGQRALVGTYRDGRKTGTWTWWHPNGMKSIEGSYEDDEPVGQWTWWNEDGQVTATEDYDATGTDDRPGTDANEPPDTPSSDTESTLPPPVSTPRLESGTAAPGSDLHRPGDTDADDPTESLEEISPLPEPSNVPPADDGGSDFETFSDPLLTDPSDDTESPSPSLESPDTDKDD